MIELELKYFGLVLTDTSSPCNLKKNMFHNSNKNKNKKLFVVHKIKANHNISLHNSHPILHC